MQKIEIIILLNLMIITFQHNQCTIKNCEKCENTKLCLQCKEGFDIFQNLCYSTKCSIYGHCNLCTEFDCIKCENGFKLLYGTCDIKENSRLFIPMLFYAIPSFVIIVVVAIYLFYRMNRKDKLHVIKDNIIKQKKPKCGSYIIINCEKNNISNIHYNDNLSNLQTTCSSNLDSFSEETIKKEKNKNVNENENNKICVICLKKRINYICDCGCCLCKEDYKKIKNGENIMCPKHKVNLKKNFVLTLEKKSNLKGNAIEKLGEKLCPICKINKANQGFNCDCNMKICMKCYNENVYVFKYNACPRCGKKN